MPDQYLWGNMPAIDVLRLEDNEGIVHKDDLNLLFAASGDLSNMIKTIASLPSRVSDHGKVNIVVNDKDSDVVCRNAAMLLLAFSSASEDEAIDCLLHLWYSAFLKREHIDVLKQHVFPKVDLVCREKVNTGFYEEKWSFDGNECSLCLRPECWRKLLSFCEAIPSMNFDEAKQVRQETRLSGFAPQSRNDFHDLAALRSLEKHRVCREQFHQDGILVPFGYSRGAFVIPNPTLFRTGKQ